MLSEYKLEEAFKTLKRNKAPGHDGLDVNSITSVYEFIKKPLLKIFNESINLGIFIEKMKIAKVTPIFKSGKKELEKQPLSGVPRKSYSENMQQIYRRTPM